jgi:RsiW-degrading membrane proteinase PrsW (M82 family)
MQTVLYTFILLLATFLWGYLFYKQDYHPQPLRVIGQIFIFGLFAMLPIFAYKAIYLNYLPILAEYEILNPVFSNSFLVGIGYFMFNIILLTTVLFALSGILSIVLTVFDHVTLRNIRQALKEESFDFIATSLLIGILIYVETFIQAKFGVEIIQTILGAILFLSVIEEYVKHLIVRFIDDKKLKDIDDAITLSIAVGLAFALIETLIYAYTTQNMDLMIYRAMLSLPVHLIASGIFGYYYGLAHYASPLSKTKEGKRVWGFKWLHGILKMKRKTVYAEEKMTEGLFFATLFHALANILFEMDLAFVVVPIIVIGLMIMSHLYKLGNIEWKMLMGTQQKLK